MLIFSYKGYQYDRKKIKELRKRAYLTQKELGKKFYMSDVAVTNWENGKRTPTPEQL